MKDKVSRINNEFYKNFPEIYLKPSKVNKFLKKYTNEVEKEIKNKFLQLKLDKNFVIYANGGFGRKEIFPISDIDISIVEKINQKILKILKNLFLFYGIKDIRLVIPLEQFQILKKYQNQI